MFGIAKGQFEHIQTSRLFRQRDVYPLLKSSPFKIRKNEMKNPILLKTIQIKYNRTNKERKTEKKELTLPDCGIEDPRNIGGGQDENALLVFADALHLDEEFGFDAAGRFRFVLRSGGAQRVDLVDEDDGRLVRARQFEQVAHQLLRLAQPFRHQIGRRDAEKCRIVGLGRHRFGQIRFARTRRLFE